MNNTDIKDILNSLLKVYQSNTFSMNCFLITRKVKKDSEISAQERFEFNLYKVSLDKDMVNFFKTGTSDTISKIVKNNNLEFSNYSVISDDGIDAVYGYEGMENLDFNHVLDGVNTDTKFEVLKDLKEIKDDILAFCLKVSTQDDSFLLFRKLTKSKVATDAPLNKMQRVQAFFDVNLSKMKVVPMQTVSFDSKVDFFFINKKVYIISKLGFEQIIGIEREFMENAKSVLQVLSNACVIDNMQLLEQVILSNKSLLRTVANIAQKKNHESLDAATISKYQDTLKLFEDNILEEKNGRLVINNVDEAKLLIRLLNDFYKQGVASGKYYGTNSGHIIDKKVN
ncbi:TPA: Kiwa anti-phage protein KwaB-like domain-containing protein [Klebsiella pneumoniae]